MNDKLAKRLLRDFAFTVPLFIVLALGFVPMTHEIMDYWVSFFLITVGVSIPFYIDMLFMMKGKVFLTEAKPRQLKQNESGIVWVWVTAALTLGVVAIVWWAISYPLFMIIDTYAQIFTTPDEIAPLLSLLTRVIVWFLGIVVFGVIIWALVSSYQGERQSYPVNPYYG